MNYGAFEPVGFTQDTIMGILCRFKMGDMVRSKFDPRIICKVVVRQWSEHAEKGKSIRIDYGIKNLETGLTLYCSELNLEKWDDKESIGQASGESS